MSDPFKVKFVGGTTPTEINLSHFYLGPHSPSAEYDAGDGWTAYKDNTIVLKGDYVAFRGDWRNAYNEYNSMFRGSFNDPSFICEFSGRFEHEAIGAYAYASMFEDCSSVVAIHNEPLQPITAVLTKEMFQNTFKGVSVDVIPETYISLV